MDTFIISTLGSTIGPILQPIIENATGAFLGNRFHELSGIHKDQKKPAQDAIKSAFEEWIIAILKNLQAQEYEDSDLRQFFEDYKKAIETFLNDPEVVEELLKPFFATTTDYRIDSQLLVRRWTALNLRQLPEEFEAASVSRAYLRRVKNAGIVTPELRKLFLAQLAQQQTNLLESIRGVWQNFDLDKYAERVETRYRVLDLSALTPPSRDDVEEDGGLLLKDVFVPQMVRESRPPRELPKEIVEKLYDKGELHRDELPDEFRLDEFKRLQQSWTQAKPESVLTAVAKPENKRLILLGDPGSGKSTLARYLLLSVLAENSEVFKTSEVFAGHLPLLVELRNYIGEVASHNCAGFLEYFHHLGKTQGYTLNHVELKEQLKTRPSLIIFDGLDEIFDPVEREKITQEIIGFALEYQEKARVLVTSRIIGYQANALQAADFREYTLHDLAPAQIKTFARGWFKLVFRDKPEEAAYRYQRIETALQHSPAIKQLAGNPLLLTMIAIIAKHQELPRERAKLYEHATKVLCHHWDVTGHKIAVAETPADFMREDDKLELLRRIAWRMQASAKGLAGNFIFSDDLRDEIADYLRTRWQLSAVEVGRMSHAMIAQLRERNFILCLYGAKVYGFVHRTFLEYFCAAEIVDRLQPGAVQGLTAEALKENIFRAHYQDSAWHEILRLICGMVKPLIAGELINAIVPKRKEAFKKTDDLILAVQCLAEVADLNKIANVAERLLGSLCGWFESTDTDRHKVDKYREKEQIFEEHAASAVETIGKSWPRREKFLSWLSEPKKDVVTDQGAYAFGKIVAALWADGKKTKQSLIAFSNKGLNSPLMAFDALARCFKHQQETYSLLQQVVQDNKHEEVRRAAVSSLAEHYPDRPETYSLLQQVVQDYKHELVREVAVSSLAEHYPDHPETYSLLQQVVQDYKHEFVREVAVSSLAKHYQNRPETYSLLQQFVQDSKHEEVRRAAVSSLAEHYQDHTETYSLLQQLLQDSMHEDVREVAVLSLAKHYQNRPETYSLLQQVVQDDKDKDVRSAAISSLAEHYPDRPETYSLLQQVVQDDPHEYVRSQAVSSLAEHYPDHPEVLPMLQQIIINDEETSRVRRSAVAELAKMSYDTGQILLSKDFWLIFINEEWLDSKALIDEKRVEEAAKKLKLPPETIRQHYEDIAKEIPLRLAWKAV
jgi:predicted NACHT family NTPase